MADTAKNGNGNRLTVTLGNVLVIIGMLGSLAFIYGTMVSRITALEVKVDSLTEWVKAVGHRPLP